MKYPIRQFIEDAALIAISVVGFVALASNRPVLYQTISSGALDVDIVDGSGNSVASPTVNFASKSFSFSAQQSTGILGTASEKIRVTNATSTPSWTLNIAATGGNTTRWTDGGNSYDFNDSSANGRLQVNPSPGVITPQNSCSATGISKGIATYFQQGTTDSITLLSASGAADIDCIWDLISVGLTQDIPAAQAAGNYQLGLTLSVF